MTIIGKQKWEEKQLYGRFQKKTNKQHHTRQNLYFKRKTESLLMVVQNSAVRINHIKVRIDKNQNIKCRLCGDRDETINHIISECSK